MPVSVQMAFRNLNASVPLSDPEVSYLNNALVRPIVAYLNTNYVSIPIQYQATLYMVTNNNTSKKERLFVANY